MTGSPPPPLAISDLSPARGAALYATYCSSCHGVQKWGTQNGPTLRGVGMASLDFYLTTGRMPAAVPWLQVAQRTERNGQGLGLSEMRALEAYLAPTVSGGPALPLVVANGNLEHGRRLFAANCEQCHGVQGDGGDLGGITWVPSLHEATINEVADAVRVGPGEMPRFGEQQLTQNDLDDVASYVMSFRLAAPADVPPFRSTGPVPEGALGYAAIILLIVFVFSFWRGTTPPARREEAVRRQEGERPT